MYPHNVYVECLNSLKDIQKLQTSLIYHEHEVKDLHTISHKTSTCVQWAACIKTHTHNMYASL